MLFFHGSEQAPRLFLAMCVWGFFLQPAEQFPVGEGFNLLLYPLSVMGPYGSHTVLIPATGTEQNTQRSQTPQANSSKISAHSESKPLHANSGFLQPDPAPDSAPSPTHLPSESLPLQGQVQISSQFTHTSSACSVLTAFLISFSFRCHILSPQMSLCRSIHFFSRLLS
ncbi:uncharacterized protein LOC113041691 isoform X2 [Carassius auratus]|uniref:Uncharacterized protein LOC113041691 isoform X2 n=1 Tax=Carassius auratus TaxID=7957 RepID=A0A6P6J707_CARAU|nr:uncharacterized protein LOC113041691 isoform X2 [Carassius auratus]